MKRLAVWALAIGLPACCMAARTSTTVNSATHMTLIDQLEQETPALVRWYDTEKEDDDGHRVHYDDPEKIPDDAKTELGAYCSAVWVSPTVMLTAAHCVDDLGKPAETASEDPATQLLQLLQQLQNGQDPRIEPKWDPTGQTFYYSVRGDITPKTKSYHSAKVLAVDWNDDIALATADSPPTHTFAPIRRGTIHDGEELHIVGHPAGMWWTYIHGYVAAQRPEYSDHNGHTYPVIQVTAPVWFGNSGGGAYDDDGNLVGMADAISRVPNTAYFIPADTIRQFMEHNKVILPQR